MSGSFVKENVSEFGAMAMRYMALRGDTRKEALLHIAGNFAGFAVRELKRRQHQKGDIRQERLAALEAGRGLHISPQAYDFAGRHYAKRTKRNKNADKQGAHGVGRGFLQKKELQLREAHRRFASSSFLFPGMKSKYAKASWKNATYSGKGFRLGKAQGVSTGPEDDEFHFEFSSQIGRSSAKAAKALSSPREAGALDAALRATTADLSVYINRKEAESQRKAVRSIRKTLR